MSLFRLEPASVFLTLVPHRPGLQLVTIHKESLTTFFIFTSQHHPTKGRRHERQLDPRDSILFLRLLYLADEEQEHCRCALENAKVAKGVMINTSFDGNKSTQYDIIVYTNYLSCP